MQIGEARRKRYVLNIEDSTAIMKAINILDKLEDDDDIADVIQSSALANICDAIDILRAVLNNDCEEFDLGE